MLRRLISLAVLVAVQLGVEGTGKTRPEGLSWQNWHMIEEHQMDSYDAESFFKIHDLDDRGRWNRDDILGIYGLAGEDAVGDGSGGGESTKDHRHLSKADKDKVYSSILGIMDTDQDGEVTLEEWKRFSDAGKELPDFGYGSGHHLDFEAEYEEHHWNQYHRDQDPDVVVKHAEDIEHELLHHDNEAERSHDYSPEIRRLTSKYLTDIRLKNVPQKYLR